MKLDVINIFCIRLFQLFVMGFFVFVVLVYFGLLLLLPLTIFFNVVAVTTHFVGGIMAFLVGLLPLFLLGMLFHTIPAFFHVLIGTGLKIVDLGIQQIYRISEIVEDVRSGKTGTPTQPADPQASGHQST
jgi:hypothetical protein